MVRGPMSRRTLKTSLRAGHRPGASRTAPLAGPVLHLDLGAVAVALAEPRAQLLRRYAHGERGGALRGPRECAAPAAEGGQPVEDNTPVRARDRHLDGRELRDAEAER